MNDLDHHGLSKNNPVLNWLFTFLHLNKHKVSQGKLMCGHWA